MSTTRTRMIAFAAATAATAAGLTLGAAQAGAATAASSRAVARCGAGSLTVTRTFTQGGAGHAWMSLVYRNHGSRSCTISGYPGLDAVTRSGHVLAHARRVKGESKLRTVTVRPGKYASAQVSWTTVGKGNGACRTAAGIDTVAPNTTRRRHFSVPVTLCALQVHPTVSGVPGYPGFAPAQHSWLTGATVDAAGMNAYLRDAEHHLAAAHDYPTQVAELHQLISFPLTGLTAKQTREARADVKSLDAFFATPHLYS